MIRRIIAMLSVLLCVFTFTAPVTVAAWDPFGDICSPSSTSPACTSKTETISGTEGIILKATRIVAILTGIASVIMLILGGFRYVLSNGDSNAINTAKNQIIYALIGLAITALAQTIVVFVATRIK